MDTDSDNENENEVNLTGFLFGNIDSAGRLEDDIFDSECKKQLSSLARYAFNSCFFFSQFSNELIIFGFQLKMLGWASVIYWKDYKMNWNQAMMEMMTVMQMIMRIMKENQIRPKILVILLSWQKIYKLQCRFVV